MDPFLLIVVIAVPALIIGLVIALAVRDRRNHQSPFDDGEISTPSTRQAQAEASAMAAGAARNAPF
ncbi:hypothetical protein L1277_002999 [Okibacterium sp. HSC-33S16]|uniref:hypothetical protein n=1 Tax=Okibacterium sp. HSC-33S16 TaxID=2910965 RepID=UPI0020A0D896|nr:hypothetical protein [Okibacterium sp. HSC-33S16]MCP2032886.1 hypothetical protein [Okibacterium sp. HSC-33S16]